MPLPGRYAQRRAADICVTCGGREVGGRDSNVAANVNVAKAASLRCVASNVGAPCLTAGSDSSQLVERALGVFLSSSPLPWFLYFPPSASLVYRLHQTRSRSFLNPHIGWLKVCHCGLQLNQFQHVSAGCNGKSILDGFWDWFFFFFSLHTCLGTV